jgi:hypothetical protein
METQELIEEVFDSLGRPTELEICTDPSDPLTFDITLPGSVRILRWINEVYFSMFTKKMYNGKYLRFKSQYAKVNFQNTVITGIVTTAASSYVQLDAAVNTDNERYTNWTIEITAGTGIGQIRNIVAFTGATLTAYVNKAWDIIPNATSSYRLTKNFIFIGVSPYALQHTGEYLDIDPESTFYSIIQLLDLTNANTLTPTDRNESFSSAVAQVSTSASLFKHESGIIYFDTSVTSSIWYSVKYRILPTALVLAGEEPNIPVNYHMALVYQALYVGFSNRMEEDRANFYKKQYIDAVESNVMQYEFEMDQQELLMIPSNPIRS